MAIYEIVLEGRQNSEDMLTVLHYDVTGATPPDWQALADAFYVMLDLTLKSFLCPNVSYIGITVREDIAGSVGLFVPFTVGDVAGTAVDADMMTQACMLVTKWTGTLTRPVQGRIFQGGLNMRNIDGTGRWEPAIRSAVDEFWEAARQIEFAGPSEADMVIKASNPTAPNTNPYNPVSYFTTQGIAAVQRRRKITSGS